MDLPFRIFKTILANPMLMANSDSCCSTQLIDGDCTFNASGIEKFTKEMKLAECGLSYTVVSIMGPGSSGKSTLLNNLFGTNFREMDAFKGRSQTTKGIWMAKCNGIEPCTLVMDLEGTDGKERGEDDTAFENQRALFALAVSDIVMMRLFSLRKTTLLFVIRDKTRTPLENLEPVLREDIQKIWDSVRKPQAYKEIPLSEFFNVEVVALSSYEEREEQFREQVAKLRQRFYHSIAPGGLAGDRRGVVPASGFSFSAEHIWKVIKENKDLYLPAHKVMLATVRCEEIANEKYASFVANEDWCQLEVAVQSGPIPGFGKKLNSLLNTYLSEYDAEATYFDEGVTSSKQKQLQEKLFQLVQPAFQSLLGHIRSGTLDKFKDEFDKALNGGEGFSVAANNCIASCMALFDEASADVVIEQTSWDTTKEKLKAPLSGPVEALLDEANSETWPSIRNLLKREVESAVSGFNAALAGFDMDEETRKKMILSLEDFARDTLTMTMKAGLGCCLAMILIQCLVSGRVMKISRIRAITKTARYAALKLLSVMTAIRLDDNDTDNIEKVLEVALVDSPSGSAATKSITVVDPLASSSWEQVSSSKTLITPVQCKSLWRQFNTETAYSVFQAISAQEANKRNNNWLPPPWAATGALVLLGFRMLVWKSTVGCTRSKLQKLQIPLFTALSLGA
ncbi:hypothetical protein Fmac_012204 [Flemingia macrophylla]|uniref:GB1/RHD3-type G domain-containing protein n=1 Tax=Flemingia macrophylla TaxID=520843 RepID=A0ABD1MQG6_9FABA